MATIHKQEQIDVFSNSTGTISIQSSQGGEDPVIITVTKENIETLCNALNMAALDLYAEEDQYGKV